MLKGTYARLLIATLCLTLSSCIVVPVRTPTQIKDASGQKTPLPTELPTPGKTTRAQIEAQYKPFKVDSGIPDLFWGRFQKSSWAVIAGMYGGGGTAGRTWGSYNLLATFDKDGLLKAMQTIPDSEIVARFIAMQKAQSFPTLDLSQPIHVKGAAHYWWKAPVDFLLCSTRIEVSMTRPRGPNPKTTPALEVISLPSTKIKDVKVSWSDNAPADKMLLELRFTEKTELGRTIIFTAEPQAALMLVRWVEQVTKPSGKP